MFLNKFEKKQINIMHILIDVIFMTVGAFLISIGTNYFLLPHKMTTGGASGIATMLYYISGVPMGLTVLIINIPLFVVSIIKIGIKFNIKTIFTTVLLSIFLEIFKYHNFLLNTNLDLFTSCVFGGGIVGLGIALVFKAGASSGGSDMLAQLLYKLTRTQSISKTLLIIETCIIIAIMIVFKDINVGLYSIIAMAISTKVVDIVFEGVYYTKVVNIITKKSDKVIPAILNDLKRGATITDSLGAHTKEGIATITCIITTPQIAKLKQIIRENDSDALMYISTVNEAIGTGFKGFD